MMSSLRPDRAVRAVARDVTPSGLMLLELRVCRKEDGHTQTQTQTHTHKHRQERIHTHGATTGHRISECVYGKLVT